jgi:hypothetical protein
MSICERTVIEYHSAFYAHICADYCVRYLRLARCSNTAARCSAAVGQAQLCKHSMLQ